MRTTINGSPSSSLPSIRKASATATEVSAAATRSSGLYGEPRYPTSRSPEQIPSTNTSTSSAMKPRHTEVCILVDASHFCPPLDAQLRMMSWALLCLSILYLILSSRLTELRITRTSFLQSSHKPANSFSGMGNSLSSNQASFSHCNLVVPQERRCIRTVKRASHVVYALLTYLITAGIP